MHRITKIITNDGRMFDTEKEAKRHIECKYTDLVSRIAAQLSNFSKYQEIKDYLDNNSELFHKMLLLKNELLENIEESEETK